MTGFAWRIISYKEKFIFYWIEGHCITRFIERNKINFGGILEDFNPIRKADCSKNILGFVRIGKNSIVD